MLTLPLDNIRTAINSVVSTFATTPIVWHKKVPAGFDRFSEGDNAAFTNINLLGFVEYGADAIQRQVEGASNWQGVKIMFTGTAWETAGLYSNGQVLANPAIDALTVNGKRYKVTNIMPDGAFETRNFIIIVLAVLDPGKT